MPGAGPAHVFITLEHVRAAGRISRADLARVSGLSKPTVALALGNLEQDGLVRVAGLRTGLPGPAAVLYEVRPDAGYVLALDVGRQCVRGSVADFAGGVRTRSSRPAGQASAHERVDDLVALRDELVASAGITLSRIEQVVVVSPGVYDPRRGALAMAAGLPGWESPGTVAELQSALGPSTVIEHDVDLFALAERDLVHGRNFRTFCVVSVGTGIGVGLVIDGQLHRGAHGAAGEIAYLPARRPAGEP